MQLDYIGLVQNGAPRKENKMRKTETLHKPYLNTEKLNVEIGVNVCMPEMRLVTF